MNTPVQENAPVAEAKKSNGMALAGLILGICAVVFSWIPFVNFLIWILGPLALVFSIIGLVKKQKKGMCIAGIILAAASFIIYYISWSVAASAATDALMSM